MIHAVVQAAVDEFMGVRAAAELLGVTNKTIYVLIGEGELQTEITWRDGPKRRRMIRIHPTAVTAVPTMVRCPLTSFCTAGRLVSGGSC